MSIAYPYLPEGKTIDYVSLEDPYMRLARLVAFSDSLDATMPAASVVVKNNAIIGMAANGSDYHLTHECERVKQNIPTGQGYELCEGCHPKNHSEGRAVADAFAKGHDVQGADLYLWGHWWCCKPCWNAMLEAGIQNVYLLESSKELFDKNEKENIVGRQFEEMRSRLTQ
jgi:deoxycytidylate deaminase